MGTRLVLSRLSESRSQSCLIQPYMVLNVSYLSAKSLKGRAKFLVMSALSRQVHCRFLPCHLGHIWSFLISHMFAFSRLCRCRSQSCIILPYMVLQVYYLSALSLKGRARLLVISALGQLVRCKFFFFCHLGHIWSF